MPPTATQYEAPNKIRDRMQSLTPSQATALIDASPQQVTYEAKWALQQIKESNLGGSDGVELMDVVEPIARVIGWAEGLSFALHQLRQEPQFVPSGGDGVTAGRSSR